MKLPDLFRFGTPEPPAELPPTPPENTLADVTVLSPTPLAAARPSSPPELTSSSSTAVYLRPDFLIRVAEEVWRLDQRAERAARLAGEDAIRGILDSVNRLRDTLAGNQIQIEDHVGQAYREGLRLDIVHVEGDPAPDVPLWVIETVKPTVRIDGRVVSAGQVVLGPTRPEGAA